MVVRSILINYNTFNIELISLFSLNVTQLYSCYLFDDSYYQIRCISVCRLAFSFFRVTGVNSKKATSCVAPILLRLLFIIDFITTFIV